MKNNIKKKLVGKKNIRSHNLDKNSIIRHNILLVHLYGIYITIFQQHLKTLFKIIQINWIAQKKKKKNNMWCILVTYNINLMVDFFFFLN